MKVAPRQAALRLFLLLLVVMLLPLACRPAPVQPGPELLPVVAAPTAMPTITPTATITKGLVATPSPAATMTGTPAPTATATSLPPVVLAVPEKWQSATGAAIRNAVDAAAWRLLVHDEPAAALAGGQAQIALLAGSEGLVVARRPLALAVPFTTRWEQATAVEVETILTQGHDTVTVMDWAEMRPTHKALRVENRLPHEPGYSLIQAWSLVALPGYETAAAALAPFLQEALQPEAFLHLAAVGDIMLDRSLGYHIARGDLAYPFAGVADLLRAADITVGNLESALGDVGDPVAKGYPFRAPPPAAQSLALAGFDVLSLANNHAMDYGPQALLQGIALLQDQGITVVGAGENETAARRAHIREVNGIRLAFLGYVNVPVEWRGFDTQSWTATDTAPGVAWGDPEGITTDVRAARREADLVVVILHSGYEYVLQPSPPQVAAARAAIDAGAAVVIGHHAHLLQGIEFYNGGVIAYGLGNFAFQIDGDPETAILHAWLDRHGVRQLEIVPAIVQFGGQPRLATEWEAAAIRNHVYHQTELLER
jgi:poly-gamma-glutamate capsule biosynthesis protein CapA/YwtB (metallophosphatase superfamily)